MAEAGEKAAKQLREITECPICLSAFADPRVLPCIHTFCFECLKRTGEATQMNPGDKMPCPLCRKKFLIPADGINGLQKNFFIENLLQYNTTLQIGSFEIICNICKASDEGKTGQIPKATMRCLQCQDNYCDSCGKVHQFQKLSRNHRVLKIGSDTMSEIKPVSSVKYCSKHTQKPLDYYCADCKKIVCVSCCVGSHASHKCKDVNTVDEEFRQTIQSNSPKVSIYADKMLDLRKKAEIRKADFLAEIVDAENAIHKRNQELKDMIDEHTKSLLIELSVIKSKHLKEMENQVEEIDRYCTILRSLEAYCTELISKGSARDICSSVDKLIVRTDELDKDHDAFIGRPYQLIKVKLTFETTDLKEVLQKSKNNVVGQINETTSQFENFLFVLGINDGTTIMNDVMKINLRRPNEILSREQMPTEMTFEAFAAVYCNTMYVTGIGVKNDEIWKYNTASGWKKCASLVQGRRRHSAAFINEVLYICGGFVDSNGRVLFSVESYNTVANKCTTAGKLVHSVHSSGNCVPFKSSLYIFGGKDLYHREVSHVQVYNTKENTCTLFTKPMPRANFCMPAVLCETSVILVGENTCFIFNFEAQTWQEREQFKAGVRHFGLVLENERVFVIGGGIGETNKDGNVTWKCRDVVRCVPLQNILKDKPIEWKILGKLPKSSLVQACAEMRMTVYSINGKRQTIWSVYSIS